jgi:hypothetical protein
MRPEENERKQPERAILHSVALERHYSVPEVADYLLERAVSWNGEPLRL